MQATHYDSTTEPDPKFWLSVATGDQIRLVRNFYASLGETASKLKILRHISAETKIAMGHGPTTRAMQRLQARGFSRHEAIKAVGLAIGGAIDSEAEQNLAINQL